MLVRGAPRAMHLLCLTCLTVLSACGGDATVMADMVLVNGRVVTVDPSMLGENRGGAYSPFSCPFQRPPSL